MLTFSFCVNATTFTQAGGKGGKIVVAKVTHKEHIVEHYENPNRNNKNLATHTYTDSYYLIYTDKETFKLKRGLVFGTLNSDDIYGKLQVGQYYKFTVFGIRSKLLGSYRNIIEVKSIK